MSAIRMVWLHTRFLFCQGCCEHFQELLVSTTTVEDLGSNPVWELANSYVDLNSDGSKDRKTHKAWETECNLTAWWMNLRACSPTFLSFRHSQSWPKSMKSGQIPASFWTKSSRSRVEVESKSSRSRVEVESKSSRSRVLYVGIYSGLPWLIGIQNLQKRAQNQLQQHFRPLLEAASCRNKERQRREMCKGKQVATRNPCKMVEWDGT